MTHMMKTLLLVEDDEDLRTALTTRLSDAGYTVNAVATYKTGLNAAINKKYDIVVTDTILLDDNFPDMNFYGTELCRQLRRRGHEGVIIGMSSDTKIPSIEKEHNLKDVYAEQGADAFIKKNDLKTLERTIEQALAARAKP